MFESVIPEAEQPGPARRPTRDQITGLILAGGRGARMGGVDGGLQNRLGVPLALHALSYRALGLDETIVGGIDDARAMGQVLVAVR